MNDAYVSKDRNIVVSREGDGSCLREELEPVRDLKLSIKV